MRLAVEEQVARPQVGDVEGSAVGAEPGQKEVGRDGLIANIYEGV